jgi:hypothetical protein
MRYLLGIVLGMFVSVGLAGQTTSEGPSSSYADTDQGLNQFLHSLIDAYKANNGQKVTALLLSMKVADKWFSDNFTDDEARRLSERYAEVFASFKSRVEKNLAKLTPSEQLGLKATKISEKPESVTATYWATPKNSLQLESYRFLYSAPQQGSVEWVDTFVYDAGGFRYIGSGAFPFWANRPIIQLKKRPESH